MRYKSHVPPTAYEPSSESSFLIRQGKRPVTPSVDTKKAWARQLLNKGATNKLIKARDLKPSRIRSAERRAQRRKDALSLERQKGESYNAYAKRLMAVTEPPDSFEKKIEGTESHLCPGRDNREIPYAAILCSLCDNGKSFNDQISIDPSKLNTEAFTGIPDKIIPTPRDETGDGE